MKIPISQDLDPKIRAQFEDIISAITAAWETEHNEDDSHLKVTANGNIISLAGMGSFQSQPKARLAINQDTPTFGRSPNNTLNQVVFYPSNLNFGITLYSYDNGSLYGNSFLQGTNNDRIVMPPVIGYYLLIGEVQWQANNAGWRRLRIMDQNSQPWGQVSAVSSSNTRAYIQQVSAIIAVPGPPTVPWARYYYLETFQDSGIDLDITGTLTIHKIS